LEVVDGDLGFIHDDVVVNWASGTLDGRVGAEVEVILERMSNITLNQSTRERVVVTVGRCMITLLGEEADVVALGTNGNSPLDLFEGQ
jgi:hypothetical protein